MPENEPTLPVNQSGGIDISAQQANVGGDVVGRDKIVQNFYGTQLCPEVNPVPPGELRAKLDDFGLKDEDNNEFGMSEYTSNLATVADVDSEVAIPAKHYVVLAAVPMNPINMRLSNVLMEARKMFDLDQWYNARSDIGSTQPKYYSPVIFNLPDSSRSGRRSFVLEKKADTSNTGKLVFSRLTVTDEAGIVFASNVRFIYTMRNGLTVFRIGRILAECWMFASLIAQLQHDIGYDGQTCLCIGMVNTQGSHLSDFADSWPEPYDPSSIYWRDTVLARQDYSCHSPNLKFCETVSLLDIQPKEQPDFIQQFGEAISIAYNHDTLRCFEKGTGQIPQRYFRGY